MSDPSLVYKLLLGLRVTKLLRSLKDKDVVLIGIEYAQILIMIGQFPEA